MGNSPASTRFTAVPSRYGRRDGDKIVEKTSTQWRKLQKHIKAQIKAGGSVDVFHRRLDPPLPARRQPERSYRSFQIENTVITETVDVVFTP